MKLLNPGYESKTVGGSLWWNSGSGTCYSGKNNATTSCDFNATGLSSNAQNKIASVVWNLGGWNSSSVYSDQMYSYERGTTVYSERPTEWTGKVALAYLSDYGYAADFNSCGLALSSYDNSRCTSVNWMKEMFRSNYMWFLNPLSSDASSAWFVASSGYLNNDYAYSAVGVRPVLYLDSGLTIESGDGSSNSPYRISVS